MDADELSLSLEKGSPTEVYLFDQFTASFNNESPKEMFLLGLSEMHKNLALLDVLEIVRDSYEAGAVVLFHKLFVDRKKYVGYHVKLHRCLLQIIRVLHRYHDNMSNR